MRRPSSRNLAHPHRRQLEETLDDDGIVAEHLSKAYFDVAERMFAAPTPILTRAFRGKRPPGIADDDDGVDEDDDMDDGGDNLDEQADAVMIEPQASVWALRDVSFRAPRGSVTGVVGGPGSGKTTLFKVLAGALPPTDGRAVLAGRPPPLINLAVQLMSPATPPQTNVRYAVALAGRSKRSVRHRLDDIFELAGISQRERKLGVTPSVFKLAVATALRLDSDVLLLDDPFATPDTAFRDACLEEIVRRVDEGATILLETRDRDALRRLAVGGLWLDDGRVAATGTIDQVLAAYDAATRAGSAPALSTVAGHLVGFNETAAIAATSGEGRGDGTIEVVLRLEVARAEVPVQVGVGLERPDGTGLWFEQPEAVVCKLPGFHRFELVANDLPSGDYRGLVQARLLDPHSETVIGRARAFTLAIGDGGTGGFTRAAQDVRWEATPGWWLYEPDDPT